MKDIEPIRKSVTLPHQLWQQIDRIRRQTASPIPTVTAVIRELIREALEARAKMMRR